MESLTEQKIKDILKNMENQIEDYEVENGFETIFDFLKEDIAEIKSELNNS